MAGAAFWITWSGGRSAAGPQPAAKSRIASTTGIRGRGPPDFGFWILDFGLEAAGTSKIQNPKSKIEMAPDPWPLLSGFTDMGADNRYLLMDYLPFFTARLHSSP